MMNEATSSGISESDGPVEAGYKPTLSGRIPQGRAGSVDGRQYLLTRGVRRRFTPRGRFNSNPASFDQGGSSAPKEDGGSSDPGSTSRSDPRPATDASFDESKSVVECVDISNLREVKRGEPLTRAEWDGYCDNQGRVRDPVKLRQAIFRSGCSEAIRPQAWMFLLDVLNFSQTNKERDRTLNGLRMAYKNKKTALKQGRRKLKPELVVLVQRDIQRVSEKIPTGGDISKELYISMMENVLQNYAVMGTWTGYQTGMASIILAILSVMGNEADTFWCFLGLVREKIIKALDVNKEMQQLAELLHAVEPAFYESIRQTCKRRGKEFCVSEELEDVCGSWVMYIFAEKFDLDRTKRLLEVLCTGRPCANFHLLFRLAILINQWRINEAKLQRPGVSVNGSDLLREAMVSEVDLNSTLILAEQLYFAVLSEFSRNSELKSAAILGLKGVLPRKSKRE